MKIVVVGAKGQLAQGLMEAFTTGKTALGGIDKAYKKVEVVALDREQLDITNRQKTMETMEKEKPKMIFNCAAMTHVDNCESEKTQAMAVNALGPRNLAMAAQKVGAKLIHISTDYVFDGLAHSPYEEWDETKPVTVYGKSKKLGEEYVKNFCQKAFIIRVSWLYGHYGPNFVKTMIRLGKVQEEIGVVQDQLGNPTNVEDVVHHMLKIALTQEYGIYHVTGRGICSWFDFAKAIMEKAQLPCKVKPLTTKEYPRPAKRPAYSALSHTMLKITVKDEMRPWEDALEDFLHKEKEKGDLS